MILVLSSIIFPLNKNLFYNIEKKLNNKFKTKNHVDKELVHTSVYYSMVAINRQLLLV